MTDPDDAGVLEQRLKHFLHHREPPKTFCPSEVARALTPEELASLGLDGWRDAMPAVRQLAWEMRERGECQVLQRGEVLSQVVTLDDVRGPIRIRRVV